MAIAHVIARLLKIKDCKVTDVKFHHGNTVSLSVKPWKNGCRCSLCSRRGKIIRRRCEPREWRDLKVGGWVIKFVYAPREILCPTHGRVEEQIPWAAPYSRTTYSFEHVMLRLCQDMTQKAAANILGISTSTQSDQLHRSIQRHRDGHRIVSVRSLTPSIVQF